MPELPLPCAHEGKTTHCKADQGSLTIYSLNFYYIEPYILNAELDSFGSRIFHALFRVIALNERTVSVSNDGTELKWQIIKSRM